jgi:hypothetical protein
MSTVFFIIVRIAPGLKLRPGAFEDLNIISIENANEVRPDMILIVLPIVLTELRRINVKVTNLSLHLGDKLSGETTHAISKS